MFPYRDENPGVLRPIVTVGIILANIAVWVLVQGMGAAVPLATSVCELGLIPGDLLGRLPEGYAIPIGERMACVVEAGRPYKSLLTSMFLHGGWLHLIGNLWFLWVFGNNVEDHMTPVGFLLFYLVVGVLAMVAHVVPDAGSTTPVIGASGAIAGVMGAYLVLWPRARILTFVPLLIFFVVYLPAGVVLAIWFGLQFLTNPNSGVAWVAHVGGFAAGVLIALALRGLFGPPRQHAVRGPADYEPD
jgi:membrane associated rhomboid family serine protease